jgi:hypothetical protein
MDAVADTPFSFTASLDGFSYVFDTTLDKFDIEALRNYFRQTFPESKEKRFETDAYAVVVPSRGGESGPYHLHFSFRVKKDSVELVLAYYAGGVKPQPDEREPFAEEVLPWLGQFFKYDSAQARLSAAFTYDLATRRSRFPLPMKLDLGVKAEIDGISFALMDRPDGVTGVRFLRAGDRWHTDAFAERRVTFASADVVSDIEAVERVITLILPEQTE